jgi:hypothetical protein
MIACQDDPAAELMTHSDMLNKKITSLVTTIDTDARTWPTQRRENIIKELESILKKNHHDEQPIILPPPKKTNAKAGKSHTKATKRLPSEWEIRETEKKKKARLEKKW